MRFQSLTPHAKGVIITFLGGLALSFDIPILRLAEGGVWALLFVRSILTVVVAALVWWVIKAKRGVAPVLFHDWRGVLVAVLYGLSTIFFLLSVFNTSTANVAFILAFNPMFGALLSWIFLRERPDAATWAAMAAMTIGVLIIVGDGLESGHLFGDLMAGLSALSIAGALTVSRASRLDFGFTPLAAAIIPAIVGAAVSMKVGFTIEHPGWIIFNGLILTPFAFWALATGPRYLSAAESGMFYLLETVLAPVWVWLIFLETPTTATLVGGAIILIALAAHSTASIIRQRRLQVHEG
ncbi:DMT family transporter [Rhizobium sp. FKL33]|uniref:DMT family transporter n=1 Tax=Rhizobium sp. FKL33 TaxID=2562307 RepID=UPI0010C1319C|nr:DMT family transporter [Rhizobium sp. FKL33]